MLNCSHCNQPIQPTSQSEICSACTNLIVDRTPEALLPFVDYLLKHANPEIELVENGIRLEDISASGTIRGYRSHLSGWRVVHDEPYETETGYYDSIVLQNREFNSRVEILESSELGITICAYVNCVAESTDLQAHTCPKCGHEYSAENPFCASENQCAFCVEDLEQERRQTEEDLSTIWSAMQSTETQETKQVWTASLASPVGTLFVPTDFEDITLPKNRLALGGVVHSRGLYFNPTRRMLFVDDQRQGCSALIALPNAPTFNDPTFHTYVDEQLQYVPVDLHALVKLMTKSGRRYAESVLNQPSQLEVTMSPKAQSLGEVKALMPASLIAVPNEIGCLEWRNETGRLSLFIGLSNDQNDQVEYASMVLRHDEATTAKLSPLFTEAPTHCVDCGVELILGACLECEEHNPKLRPDHNDLLNELPEYIVVWLESVARHHMLTGVQNQGGVLSVVAHREWMNTAPEDSSVSSTVCIDYVKEHFFCLESNEVPESDVEENGTYLSPDGKVLVEIHPMTIEATVYPDSIPAWN